MLRAIQLECHIFGIMLTAMNSGTGQYSHFFGKDVGLALAPKLCLDQSRAFKGVNSRQVFTVGRKTDAPSF